MSAIYLIRHGQASFGEAVYDQLSPFGVVQSQILGKALAAMQGRVSVAYSGDMQRHRQTAKACMDAMGSTVDCAIDAGWNEFDHDQVLRAYHGPDADVRHGFADFIEKAIARWMSGEHDADYTEAWPNFRARVFGALERVVTRVMEDGAEALVFTSGGPISTISAELLKISPHEGLRAHRILVNAGITKLIVGKHGPHLSTLNGHAHFDGDSSLITYI